MKSSLLMWRRLFLMMSTPGESDHIFTSFDVPVTQVLVVQAEAWLGKDQLCPRRLSYARHVEQHEDGNQPAFFSEERTSSSGGGNRWDGTPDGELCGFGARWT
jgi:hypothetical protein